MPVYGHRSDWRRYHSHFEQARSQAKAGPWYGAILIVRQWKVRAGCRDITRASTGNPDRAVCVGRALCPHGRQYKDDDKWADSRSGVCRQTKSSLPSIMDGMTRPEVRRVQRVDAELMFRSPFTRLGSRRPTPIPLRGRY